MPPYREARQDGCPSKFSIAGQRYRVYLEPLAAACADVPAG